MANNIDDLSDVRPDGLSPGVSPKQLPIRGEKRIVPSAVSPFEASAQAEEAWLGSGSLPPDLAPGGYAPGRTDLVEDTDFYTRAAVKPLVDYVVVRLAARGVGGDGQPDGNPAVYRFLVNPATVQIARSTIDGQAMTRGGWQIGVWGEDALSITLTGKTAGQYFAFGLTDLYEPYCESYRNLQQLQVVFENNGYWFEGEQQAEGPLAADFARRRIKMHADVQLVCGNFMWQGMFDTLTVAQSADTPFLLDFTLTFVAWKERFRSGSPYPDTKHNDRQRGHAYESWRATALAIQKSMPDGSPFSRTGQFLARLPDISGPVPVLAPPTDGTEGGTPLSPAQQSQAQQHTVPWADSTAQSAVPMGPVLASGNWSQFWNGGL